MKPREKFVPLFPQNKRDYATRTISKAFKLYIHSVFCCLSKAQGTGVSVQKTNVSYLPLNDTVTLVKDSLSFEQRVEMVNRKKRKQDSKLLRFEAGITGGLCDR